MTATATPITVRPLRCSQCSGIIRVLELGPDDEVPSEQCANCKLDTAEPRWMNGADRAAINRDGEYPEDDEDPEPEDNRYRCTDCGSSRFQCVETRDPMITDTRDYDYDDTELYFDSDVAGDRVTSCMNCGARVHAMIVNFD